MERLSQLGGSLCIFKIIYIKNTVYRRHRFGWHVQIVEQIQYKLYIYDCLTFTYVMTWTGYDCAGICVMFVWCHMSWCVSCWMLYSITNCFLWHVMCHVNCHVLWNVACHVSCTCTWYSIITNQIHPSTSWSDPPEYTVSCIFYPPWLILNSWQHTLDPYWIPGINLGPILRLNKHYQYVWQPYSYLKV